VVGVNGHAWGPTAFKRFIRAAGTSTGATRVLTDAGEAFIKPMGNPQGPHALAADLVGTGLAKWFGLQAFEVAVFSLEPDDEVPFPSGGRAEAGPAFATRFEPGHAWSGTAEELEAVENRDDLSRLVVFDTWLRNCDRYPADPTARKPNYDNVFLSEKHASPGRFRVVAIDHGHAFTCGRDITAQIATIDRIQDEGRYGYFPTFRSFIVPDILRDGVAKLGTFDAAVVESLVASIPAEWDVSAAGRQALIALVVDRAAYLARDPEATAGRLAA
jgi:hypothetical protein